MTESLQEIERLVDEYAERRYVEGGEHEAHSGEARIALLSAITCVVQERDAFGQRLGEAEVRIETDTRVEAVLTARIAVLEKALRRRGCEFGINATTPQALACQCGTCAALSTAEEKP